MRFARRCSPPTAEKKASALENLRWQWLIVAGIIPVPSLDVNCPNERMPPDFQEHALCLAIAGNVYRKVIRWLSENFTTAEIKRVK
jgi:hypothetical protein